MTLRATLSAAVVRSGYQPDRATQSLSMGMKFAIVCIIFPAKQLTYCVWTGGLDNVPHPIFPAQVPGASDAGATRGVHSRLSVVESWTPRGESRTRQRGTGRISRRLVDELDGVECAHVSNWLGAYACTLVLFPQQGVVGEIPALHGVPCTNSHEYGAVDKVNSHGSRTYSTSG